MQLEVLRRVLVPIQVCSSELNVTVDFPRDANSKSPLDGWSVVFAIAAVSIPVLEGFFFLCD